MRKLDEVNTAVVAGDVKDLVVIGVASCYLIAACERVRDYDRAAEWCTRLKAFSAKWGLRPLFAVCRTQYASICMWRGTWLEAQRCLRHVPAQNRTDRAAGLDLLVRARVSAGDLQGARLALAELTAIATRVATPSFRATASLASGRVALASSRADEARVHIEDAVDLFLQSAAPYELACSRIELAKTLAALGPTPRGRRPSLRLSS